MSHSQPLPESSEPTPLSRNEIAVIAGAGLIVLGTLLPAINPGFGSAKSLAESGNTVVVILWAIAAAALWKVARRQAYDTVRIGQLCVLLLVVYFVFLWIEGVGETVKTFFGTLQSSFRATAWVVSTAGAVLIAFSGMRETRQLIPRNDGPVHNENIRASGATLAVLGCLLGLAIVNPFGPMAPAEFRREWHAWTDEIHALRWIILGTAALATVACFLYPPKAPTILRPAIRAFGLLIGVCLIMLASLIEPSVRSLCVTVAVLWSVVSIGIFATSQSRPMLCWQQLIVYSPFVAFIVLLVVSGEIGDGSFVFIPAFAVATGYVICRNTTFVDAATFSAALVVGLPAGLMAFTGVPNEIAETCGMSHGESRTILLAVGALLAWAVYLSFRDDNVTSTS